MPLDATDVVNSLVIENLKLIAGSGTTALAKVHEAQASGFHRREGYLDAHMALTLEDMRYINGEAARAQERLLGGPIASQGMDLAGAMTLAASLAKNVFAQPPTGWTPYPGSPGANLGTTPT